MKETPPPIGRPVRVVSLSFRIGSKSVEEVAAIVDAEGARGCDLMVLPETWTGLTPERLDGPVVTMLSALARKHGTYIVCPVYRWEGEHRRNSAVLLDRQGEIAGVYDKVYPYWSEFDLIPPVQVGPDTVPVFQSDFGRVGIAICFDVNFPVVWQRLAEGQAEIVVWPSAYSAGTSLQSHALNHHYAIVTATSAGDCQVYDITGERILNERGNCGSEGISVSRITLDLDRGIYHENFNREKRDQLLCEHGDELLLDQSLPREEWFVLKAKQAGVSARALAREYGMEELRDYLSRSRREIDDRRRGTASGC